MRITDRSYRTGNCKNRMKICIERHDAGVPPEREPKDIPASPA